MNPIVNEPGPRAARARPAGAAHRRPASSGPASASSCRPAGVSSGGPLVPREQLDFQLGFQRPDLAGQHRLGDVQGLGGPAEVQLLRDNHESSNQLQIDEFT